ncbi:hypothetical protein [Flavobacterium sp. UMI-01]|nr:hypothetical protein [Flavobacterium sp. UMI-01]
MRTLCAIFPDSIDSWRKVISNQLRIEYSILSKTDEDALDRVNNAK